MKKRILLVDDEPDIVAMLKFRLEKEGYEVITASSGEDCLKEAEEKYPDVILLDVLLPGISGLEVSRRLKANSVTKDIPIIMVTALIGSDAREKGLEPLAIYLMAQEAGEQDKAADLAAEHDRLRKESAPYLR